MRLKITNPDQVILVRGNHEDISICSQYGFISELQGKFADAFSEVRNRIVRKLQKFYELLPVVAYLGCQENEHTYNFLQCCHGGIEIGFNPQSLLASNDKQYQLLGELQQATQCLQLRKFLPKKCNMLSYLTLQHSCKNHIPVEPASFDHPWNGFMWNDFQPFAYSNLLVQEGRGIKYSKEMSDAVLQLASSSTHRVCGIMRAHQHNQTNTDPLMREMLESYGVARHWSNNREISFNPWQGIVCTLLLSPDSSVALRLGGFKGFNFDTTLFITTAPLFTKWNMHIVNIDIYKNIFDHQAH